MALAVMVEATVTYACRLSEEDEKKVMEYIGDSDLSIEDAVIELYFENKIDLYKNSHESDFYTNCVTEVLERE